MNLREALIAQRPSLQLQRAAADEIAKLHADVARLVEAINKLVYEDGDGYLIAWREDADIKDIINPVKDLL